MQRIYVASTPLAVGKKVSITDKDFCHQCKTVLRLSKDDQVRLFNGSGTDYVARIELIARKECVMDVIDSMDVDTELEREIALYQAVPNRMSKFERVLNDGVQLGINRFVPVLTERVQKPFLTKRDRMEKIIVEATEQSERSVVAELTEEMKFADILSSPPAGENVLLGARAESSDSVNADGPVNVFIGPEGGFTDAEVEAAREANFKIVSLGKRVLRTELAGIVYVSSLLWGNREA